MTTTCPNGHQSETSDYCDQCGARIEGAAGTEPGAGLGSVGATAAPLAAPGPTGPSPSGAPSLPVAGDPTAGPTRQACPTCQTPRVGDDRYCEGCGYDFTAPAVVPTPAGPGPLSDPSSTAAWEAVAVADREYYDRVAPEGVTFPLHCPSRTFLLAGDEIRVGRHSSSRGIQPEVDLAGAPEDGAISHLHCLLIEQPDGSYKLVDPGSTNGTTLNDDPTPLMANIAVALADGDRIHLGAWPTITVRARPAPVVPSAPIAP